MTQEYRGCVGTIEWSEEDGVYYGKVVSGVQVHRIDGQRVKDLILYEADDPSDLQHEFEDAVDDYLQFLEELVLQT